MNIDDPIGDAFPIAIAAAKHCCRDRNDARGLCFAYHSLWPRLRRIGCTGSAWLHAENYVRTFRRLAAAGSRRVLVTGTADYTLIAFLIHAFREEGVEPDVTVLDLCATPLAVNQWYARRNDVSIETVAADLLDFEDHRGFDLVTTDNFLARFSANERVGILTRWRELLRPGGILVTAQRISVGSPAGGPPDDAEVAQKLDRIRMHATEKSNLLDIPVERLLVDAARYYDKRRHVPVRSPAEMATLFSCNGFDLEAIYDPPPRAADCPQTSGLSRLTQHTMFVARKRATRSSQHLLSSDYLPVA